ncbi:MAG: nucleotidyl transferase AbiEii/AbiGii toxin family protein [bacterium]|nr:nucleotidyl transferase AbiEii/AbiGii toxin family protein [bacterium]
MERKIEKKIINVLKNLVKENISFYIVGGMALVLYGIPRTTLDIDIVIPSNKEMVDKLFEIFKKYSLKSKQKDILLIKEERLLIGQWITFEDEKGRELFDIFIEEKDKFKEVYKRIKKIEFKEIFLPVAPLEIIKQMKSQSEREIDIYDIKLIEEFEKNNEIF